MMNKKMTDKNQEELAKVINIEEARNRNVAKIKSIKEIQEKVKDPPKDVSLAVGILFPSDGSEPQIICNARINPLEMAGMLLRMSTDLTKDIMVNPITPTEEKDG